MSTPWEEIEFGDPSKPIPPPLPPLRSTTGNTFPPLEGNPAERNPLAEDGALTLPFAPLSSLAEIEEPDWAWASYVARGSVTAIGGWPKVGKTRLLFALLAALTTGEPFLERATRSTGVLFLTEERKGTLGAKLRVEPVEGVHALRLDQAQGVPWAEVVGQSVAYCRRHGLDVLVVDTFPRWALIEDENAPGPVIAALSPLEAAAASGLAVVILLHQRKARGRYGEAIRGSNALTGSVDVVVELERTTVVRDSNARALFAVSRFDETPESLVIALTDSGYAVLGDAETAKAEDDRGRVLAYIEEVEVATAEEIKEATGIAEATVRRHAAALHDAGLVGRSGGGVRGDPFRFLSAGHVSTAETNPTLLNEEEA